MSLPPRICGVCDHALDSVTTGSGIEFVHPQSIADSVDHEAVPVAPPANWRGPCDFCSTGRAAWELPAKTFTTPIGTVSSGGWAVCDGCVKLIEKSQ